MALRRLTVDIENSPKDKQGRLRYSLTISSSGNETKTFDNLTAGKLHTLIEFATDDALDSLPHE
jgi:hypothetical protein